MLSVLRILNVLQEVQFLRPRAVIVLILALESLALPLVSMETYRTAHFRRSRRSGEVGVAQGCGCPLC